MKDFIFVLLAILVFALIVVGVFLGLEGNRDFICKKLFSRKKLKKPLNAKLTMLERSPEALRYMPYRGSSAAIKASINEMIFVPAKNKIVPRSSAPETTFLIGNRFMIFKARITAIAI